MKDKGYIIWGSLGHAKVVAEVIKQKGGSVLAFFDNNHHVQSAIINIPIFYGMPGFLAWLKHQESIENLQSVVAIGGSNGKDRWELIQMINSYGIPPASIFHESATISRSAKIGVGVHILANSVVAADSRIGHACIVNNSANVDHECILGVGVHIAPGATLCGRVHVGDFSLVGAGAVVLPRIKIGQGAIIGAGAVVTRDVPAGFIVVGNPAKFKREIM